MTVTLTDIHTGAERSFSSHNIGLTYLFSAFSQWYAGKNNTGYQALSSPTQIEYGSGTGIPAETDTGLFTPITGSLTNISYATANYSATGTTLFVFNTPAGVVTTQVTEAILRDKSGNPWLHSMFEVPFTPSSTEIITMQWESTIAN